MTFRSAAELASDPDLMRPPPLTVPPIGVAGRVVLLTLGPKGGKSTTAAGLIVDASHQGVAAGLLTLDEAKADSLQRIVRFGADLDHVYLDDVFEPATLEEEVATLGLQFLAVDHLGKLAERSPDFGPGSQGDPVLWGRLIAPFTHLARTLNLAVVLLDQARRSDGRYAGSSAKAGTVDLLCELHAKDGGLVGAPRGRVVLPAFRVDLDEGGRPVFTTTTAENPRLTPRVNLIGEHDRRAVLTVLQNAEPDGLKTTPWQSMATEATGLGRTAFYEVRRGLFTQGYVSHTSRVYRVTPAGERWLGAPTNGARHAA